jgi:halocyanin-like protein
MTGSGSVEVAVSASGNGGNFAFAPPAIRVSPGTTVTWTWTGEGGAHNVVGQDSAFDSGDPQSGSNVTFEHTFDGSDTFLYQCEPHGGLGMRGAVVVG